MNRLILIGNGFDLAHGIKTRYNDFILWYITNCFSNAMKLGQYEDELISVRANHYTYVQQELLGKKIDQFIFEKYTNGDLSEFMGLEASSVPSFIFSNDYRSSDGISTSAFKIDVKSELLSEMIKNCYVENWVDIENLFYSLLKKALVDENRNKSSDIKNLNQSLTFIINELRVYLSNLDQCKENIDEYRILISEPIKASEIVDRLPLVKGDLNNGVPSNTLILNFNYTDTVEQYLSEDRNIKVNYIHGQLNEVANPMIFGFGDELDSEYSKFELDRTKEIFKYIKSFWYFKTSNYHELLRFIQGEKFQVYILGHSCGLSDRTMLNMIFEHENCISIKIFYYRNPTNGDINYTELTEEISRHFKDKRQMRLKIVPFDKSSEMPQKSPF